MHYHDIALVILVLLGNVAALYCGLNLNKD